MKKITNIILDVQNRSTYFDYVKSEYMLVAQDLMITIFDSEDNMTPESKEEIQFYINRLNSLKKDLLRGLDEFTDNVMLLNNKINGEDIDG